MQKQTEQPLGMLSPYRVIDLTDERGEIAGMVLGDLGADVIKVEPPGGSTARQCGPMLDTPIETERSLQFSAYNRNKRSIVLDLGSKADQETLLELVSTADFLLESVPGSDLARNNIGFEDLREVNPGIVHVQVSAFGSSGPAANWPSSDLTIVSLGGPVALQGNTLRPPVRVSIPQVWRHTGVEAAVAALVGHARMRKTGEAQLVDVSAQCVMTWTMLNAMDAAAIQGHDFERKGSDAQTGQITLPIIFECADGYIVAPPTKTLMKAITEWLIEEKLADRSWIDRDWDEYEAGLLSGGAKKDLAIFSQFCLNHRKQELLDRGLKLGVTFAPVNTIEDILAFDHLKQRQYWLDIKLANGMVVRTPGLFSKSTAIPLSVRRPAPGLDQHGHEIKEELKALKSQRRGQAPADKKRVSTGAGATADNSLPFDGLKVADFSWVGVGPISTRCLADHGATVIHVESEVRPDVLRGAPPFKDGQPGWNRSHFFGEFNASKLGLLLNLKDQTAIGIARELIQWADVFIESFSPGTVAGLGLGYEVAREINPDIIMVSTCLMGQTGPASSMAGYGYHAGAMAGFYEITGWPDLPPDGPWVAYTDTIAPRFVLATLMSALDHRSRTGQGQHIDAAQFEMGLHFLAPEILDYQVNGHLAGRAGNQSRDAAPHGVYPCAGKDQWCAIAIENEQQWSALCRVLGLPAWTAGKQFATAQGRLMERENLDIEIGNRTRTKDRDVLAMQLRNEGIPAGEVKRSSDLLLDQQYAHRNFYQYLDHPEMGHIPYAGHQFCIDGYASGPRFPAPVLGQHSVQVMQEILHMSDEAIAEAFASGAIA